MVRGFIQGAFWALLLGLGVVSFVSLSHEQPVLAEGPPAPQMFAPALTNDAQGGSVSVNLGEELAPRLAATSPRVPEPVARETAPVVATQPADRPETAKLETTLDVPANTTGPALSSTADTALSGDALQAPAAVDTQRVVPQVPEMDNTPANAPLAPVAAPEPEILLAQPETQDAPEPLADPVMPETQPLAEAPVIPADTALPAPASNETAQTSKAVVAEPIPETNVAEPSPEQAPPTQSSPAVRVNRPGIAAVAPPDPAEAPAELDGDVQDVPALLRYATPFENPDDLPLISVILVDDGAMANAADMMSDLPIDSTVVVDALADNAGTRAAAYRAAGVELAMQLSLPSGAQPVDVEIAFEAAFGIVADAVILFSDGTGLLQDDRRVTEQVMQILAADGRGFVSVQRGFGNALRAAEQEGVPSAAILRDLDDTADTTGALTRALDQAALRARQSGAAVLVGRMTPQTLEVLTEWAGGLDTSTVLIAPASAILLAQTD